MQVRLLDVTQSDEWHGYLDQMTHSDIYFTPEYCKIYEDNGEGKAQLYVFIEGEGIICYPYLLRAIPSVGSYPVDLYDITTPYGYGGPLCNVNEKDEREQLFQRFTVNFHSYCQENHIVSEFVRFHPILQNSEDYLGVCPSYLRETVYIDLTRDHIREQYAKKKQNRIRHSLKEDLLIVHRPAKELEHFLRLYYSTMDKKQASSYYYFSEQFLHNTVHYLNDHIELIEVEHEGQVIASCMFLHDKDIAHYHLMGSNKEYLHLNAVNLMIDYAAHWAKDMNCSYLHLGGGHENQDDLLRFKKGFNPECQTKFYIGRKIHCPEHYAALVSEQFEADDTSGEHEGYFPLYRCDSPSKETIKH